MAGWVDRGHWGRPRGGVRIVASPLRTIEVRGRRRNVDNPTRLRRRPLLGPVRSADVVRMSDASPVCAMRWSLASKQRAFGRAEVLCWFRSNFDQARAGAELPWRCPLRSVLVSRTPHGRRRGRPRLENFAGGRREPTACGGRFLVLATASFEFPVPFGLAREAAASIDSRANMARVRPNTTDQPHPQFHRPVMRSWINETCRRRAAGLMSLGCRAAPRRNCLFKNSHTLAVRSLSGAVRRLHTHLARPSCARFDRMEEGGGC